MGLMHTLMYRRRRGTLWVTGLVMFSLHVTLGLLLGNSFWRSGILTLLVIVSIWFGLLVALIPWGTPPPAKTRLGLWLCRQGWHAKPYEKIRFDGASWHVRCQRCEFSGMLDSQGNIF